jgi:hypothetical protein
MGVICPFITVLKGKNSRNIRKTLQCGAFMTSFEGGK